MFPKVLLISQNFARASAAPGGDAKNDFIATKTVVLGVIIRSLREDLISAIKPGIKP